MNPRSEEIKKQDIIDNLTWDDSVNANDVNVRVENSTAVLEGTISSYAEKLAAERNALDVPGINVVENNLTVLLPATINLPSDAEITSNIENKLLWDSQIDSTKINVQTIDGVVTLSGEVDTYWEKNQAEDLALSTLGVIDVINNLTVVLTKSLVDLDIESDIKAAYRRSAVIDENKIGVSVNNGIVTLTGTVSDYFTKYRAYRIATYTSGVVDVIDDIVVI